jgi:hypothetical protein
LLSCPSSDNTPLPTVSYPVESFDYTAEFSDGQEIVIDSSSCEDDGSGNPANEFCSDINTLQFVKFNGKVGLLKEDSQDITSTSEDGNLPAWPQCGPKKTYRFCVETEDNFFIYEEESNSVELRPIRYKFAVRFSP